MGCIHIYLELGNKCKNFSYSIDRLYYTLSKVNNAELFYYPNLKRFLRAFVKDFEINIDRYKRCVDLRDLINSVKSYIDLDPDRSLLYIYDFCSKFE